MHTIHKRRIAFALKCKPEEVPDTDKGVADKLAERRNKMREVKHGKSIHQPV